MGTSVLANWTLKAPKGCENRFIFALSYALFRSISVILSVKMRLKLAICSVCSGSASRLSIVLRNTANALRGGRVLFALRKVKIDILGRLRLRLLHSHRSAATQQALRLANAQQQMPPDRRNRLRVSKVRAAIEVFQL